MRFLRRAAVVGAAAIAALAFTAGPAAAGEGWYYHSSYEGDVFFDPQCAFAGDELVDSGAIASWQCLLNDETGLWDLYVIDGPWVHHSSYPDVFTCADAGQALVASGQAYTWKCIGDGTGATYASLYIIS